MDAQQWHYFDEKGQRQGPVDSATLKTLAAQKRITSETVLIPASENTQTAKSIIDFAPGENPSPQENPFPDRRPTASIPAKPRPAPTSAKGGEVLVRMQCGVCKSMLACDFDRRRKPMICPLCERLAPLVYIPPDQGGKPVYELPVAKYPSPARTWIPKLLSPFLWLILGFLACATLYALDYGQPIDRITRKVISAIREEFGGTKTTPTPPEPTTPTAETIPPPTPYSNPTGQHYPQVKVPPIPNKALPPRPNSSNPF